MDLGNTFLFQKPMCTLRSSNDIVIGPFGKIYKCWENIGKNDFSVGDIVNGLDKKLLKRWEEVAILTNSPKCNNCPFFAGCLGGCPLYKINGESPTCPFQRYTIDFYLKKISGEENA